MKQILVILLSTFCSAAAAEWNYRSQTLMPDGSILVSTPTYFFESTEYRVFNDTRSAEGVCANLGKSTLVRWSWTGHTINRQVLALDEYGKIANTIQATGFINSVQCK